MSNIKWDLIEKIGKYNSGKFVVKFYLMIFPFVCYFIYFVRKIRS